MKSTILFILVILLSFPLYSVIHKLADYPSTVRQNSVTACGDTVYVANGIDGLKILSVANPNNPELLGCYNTMGSVQKVVVVNQIAYIADGDSGLVILDVSNPTNPALLCIYATEGCVLDIFIADSLAYIADDDGGLLILDISNPANPLLLGSDNTIGYTHGVWVDNEIAYIIGGPYFKIVDVSNPSNMQLLSSVFHIDELNNKVVVKDSIAYLAGQNYGLTLFDVSNPANPTYINGVWLNGSDITILENTAYLAAGMSFCSYDISDPYNLVQLNSYQTEYGSISIAVDGDRVYGIDIFNGLQIIDFSDIPNAQLLGTYHTVRRSFSVITSGDTAYLCSWGGGYLILDLSNPQIPLLLGSYASYDVYAGSMWTSCVQGNYAYLCTDNDGLRILDVSNPAMPQLVGSTNQVHANYGLFMDGNTVYNAGGNYGLQIFDVSDVTNPTLIGSYNTPGFTWCVKVSQGIAYVADGNSGLQIFNVSTPQNPVLLGSYDTAGYCQMLELAGNKIYLADPVEGLVIIDVANPENPTRLGTIKPHPTSKIRKTFLKNNYLYVSDQGWNEITIYDVSNNALPEMIYTYSWNCLSFGLWQADGKLYVAADVNGLQILNLDGIVPAFDYEAIPETNISISNYPNPFNPKTTISFSLNTPSIVKLDIYNSKGQKVINLIDGYLSNGTHNVQWSGTNSKNQSVASGIYFTLVNSGGKTYTKKLLLLK